MSTQLYLASRSPRRIQLLQQLGLHFEILPADVPEQPAPGQLPADYALATALAKATAAAGVAALPLPVLAADTDVSIDGQILGKPRDRNDALSMLQRLSGRTHEVCSAVVVIGRGRVESAVTVTRVSFGPIGAAQAARAATSPSREGAWQAWAPRARISSTTSPEVMSRTTVPPA